VRTLGFHLLFIFVPISERFRFEASGKSKAFRNLYFRIAASFIPDGTRNYVRVRWLPNSFYEKTVQALLTEILPVARIPLQESGGARWLAETLLFWSHS
jgi:hypothetical protein